MFLGDDHALCEEEVVLVLRVNMRDPPLIAHDFNRFLKIGESELARGLGFRFPVGIDQDWRTLRRWWFDGGERDYTSVTFLLDQEGVIRAIHPGGAYTRDEAARLEGEIRRLLKAAR